MNSSNVATASQQDILLREMDDIQFSIINIVVSIVLAGSFVVLLMVIVGLIIRWILMKQTETMKRNQKIMIGLIVVLVIIQISGSIFRIIYSSIDITIVNRTKLYIQENYPTTSSEYLDAFVYGNSTFVVVNSGVPYADIVGQQTMNGLQTLLQLGNVSFLILIMGFIGNVFLKTVSIIQNFNTKVPTIIFNVITGIFFLTAFSAVFVVSILTPFIQLKLVQNILLYLYLVGFIVFFIDLLLHLIAVIVLSIKVLLTIRASQSKTTDVRASNQAFIKVIILQITLILSGLLQIIAILFGTFIPQNVYFSFGYVILHNLGIFIFATVSLALYYPMFSFGANNNNLPSPRSVSIKT